MQTVYCSCGFLHPHKLIERQKNWDISLKDKTYLQDHRIRPTHSQIGTAFSAARTLRLYSDFAICAHGDDPEDHVAALAFLGRRCLASRLLGECLLIKLTLRRHTGIMLFVRRACIQVYLVEQMSIYPSSFKVPKFIHRQISRSWPSAFLPSLQCVLLLELRIDHGVLLTMDLKRSTESDIIQFQEAVLWHCLLILIDFRD